MAWISKSITAVGLVLLAHACYSAHEHAALQAFRASTATTASSSSSSSAPLSSSTSPAAVALPLDISIETVVALIATCLGLVLNTSALRPVQWRVWAGKIEREGPAGFITDAGEVARDYVGNPFRVLETRPGFVDIRKQRKEFAEWVKNGAGM